MANRIKPEDIADSMRAAKEMREEALSEFASGELSFDIIVDRSKTKRYHSYSAIKLSHFLEYLGWDRDSAIAAIEREGFRSNDTLKNIRNSASKQQAFSIILQLDYEDWGSRPKLPYNWPWLGKFDVLLEDMSKRERLALARDMGLDVFVKRTEEADEIKASQGIDPDKPRTLSDVRRNEARDEDQKLGKSIPDSDNEDFEDDEIYGELDEFDEEAFEDSDDLKEADAEEDADDEDELFE